MESAGAWKAPGRHPPAPGPSHTPRKSWAPAHRPPRIPAATTAAATTSCRLQKQKETPKPTTSINQEPPARRFAPSSGRLHRNRWSPSSESAQQSPIAVRRRATNRMARLLARLPPAHVFRPGARPPAGPARPRSGDLSLPSRLPGKGPGFPRRGDRQVGVKPPRTGELRRVVGIVEDSGLHGVLQVVGALGIQELPGQPDR